MPLKYFTMLLERYTVLLENISVLLNDIFDFQDLRIGIHASLLSTGCIVSTVSPSVKDKWAAARVI